MFVKEARHDDGQLYTPRSLTQLHSGIKHFINSKSEHTEPLVKLQDTSIAVFREIQNILEHRFCELHAEGVGTECKQSEIIHEVKRRFCGKRCT